MDKNNYSTYTATEFLNDDYFLESEQHPTAESQLYWARLQAEHPTATPEIERARAFLHAVAQSTGEKLSIQEVEQLWNSIESRTIARKQLQHTHRFLHRAIAAAACIALLAVGGWFALVNAPSDTDDTESMIASIKKPDIEPTDEIQLILSDTQKLTINGQESKLHYKKGTVDIDSKTVKMDEKKVATETYNQLIVPAGKRSSITFHDGTRVQVNANTRVVYPVEFAAHRREIYVEGEIYLEVSPDKQRPFIVKTDQMDVRVLGTKFNVNAYTTHQTVVLVSGKVEVATQRHASQTLKPNEMLAYDGEQVQVQTVHAADYISWIDGYCLFQKENVSVVAARLSQYYQKTIVVSPRLQQVTCSGKLNLRDSLDEVLETLAQTISANIEKTSENNYLIK